MDSVMEAYSRELEAKINAAYGVAGKCRGLGLDPSSEVEAYPAGDIADRVEGRVGPPGIAAKIREVGRDNITEIIDYILESDGDSGQQENILQAIRTSLDILTEGVVAASIEGVSDSKILANPDGSKYLAIYFAGPIRSAGGTGQGMAVLVGDYIRRKVGLAEYRPTEDEIERYVEEVKLYDERASRLQYLPSDDEIRKIIRNNPVCVDGDPTEDVEVPIHRDLARVETNRVRGGMCLVVAEGIAQKAKKLYERAGKLGLDWDWLSDLKDKVKDGQEDASAKPAAKFMDEVVGGRPIFAAPSSKGAFRLRYGRCRGSGIAAKSMHPASMILTGGFIATGTQVKVERPGKGCIITECDEVDGPIVKLRNGSVLRVEDSVLARDLRLSVSEILFLGDILVPFGDFKQTNTSLLPAGYCEEWWRQEMKEKGRYFEGVPSPSEAVSLSRETGVALHPRYTYYYEDVSAKDITSLVEWLSTGSIESGKLKVSAGNSPAKRVIEFLGVPHEVSGGFVLIDEYVPLTASLGILSADGSMNVSEFMVKAGKVADDVGGFELVSVASSVPLRRKAGTTIGCRMGRPEKAKERRMQPAVHVLFPLGDYGGRERSVNVAAQNNDVIPVEVAGYKCGGCGQVSLTKVCPVCGVEGRLMKSCPSCRYVGDQDVCPSCKKKTRFYDKRSIPIRSIWQAAIESAGVKSVTVKGVQGMISAVKIPEPLMKGVLRAANNVYVFKDGTIRFDATDAPLTHFKPNEIEVSVDKLKELGYASDIYGRHLTSEDQVVELRPQDIVIPSEGAVYLSRVANFVDQLLTRFYGMEAFYNVSSREDLLGHLVSGLAPHTSAAIVGRIVGFTKARVCFAHPFWHAAKRRNCDGDEDAFMLLMDVLLNFSRKYLPEKRGGHMDAPLVVTTLLNPYEIDDEAHKMEIVTEFSLDFYEKTWEKASPYSVSVKTVKDVLATSPCTGLMFTHSTGNVNGPVHKSKYVKLKTMQEKVEAQLEIAEKIRAIDEKAVAEIVINSHFLRDTYGNLRAFTRQKFRCVKCNASYRRIPLAGKCTKCGGRILLTVTEGSIRKYLELTQNMANKYGLSEYLKQRLKLLDQDITSLFTNDLAKQVSLAEFM
ncbi:MAG: DNA polymerase II large subunit [Candidatus Altiarchaeota archaeon]